MAKYAMDEINQRKVAGRKLNSIFIDIKTLRRDLGAKFVKEQRQRVNELMQLAQCAFDREDYGKARMWAEEAFDVVKNNPTGKEWKKGSAN